MSDYLMLLDPERFSQHIRPALADSWKKRSFLPCRDLCAELLPVAHAYAERYHTGAEEPFLAQVVRGVPFARHGWRLLVGEVLLYSATEIPDLQTTSETLTALLAPKQACQGIVPRADFVPIQQVHFGSRDFMFGGGYYRPEHAGYNDAHDVKRLSAYLSGLDPARWTVADLQALDHLADDEERAEELAFAREWFPVLRDVYRRASEQGYMIVCERV
ncbi:MAG: hypothetical protein ACK4RK_17640 [Gemmataceae bacterium]